MNDIKKTENYLKNLNINLNPQQDQRICDNLHKILKELKESKNQPAAKTQPHIWRKTMKSKITKFTAAALIIIALIIGIRQLGAPFDANQAYAGVVDLMKQARTFSCTNIDEMIKSDGQKLTYEDVYYFKEPDLERYESRTYLGEELHKELIVITDYTYYQKLILDGIKKQAEFQERFEPYIVDSATGELERKNIENSFIYNLRDRIIRLGERAAVEDLGVVELEGRSVRKLQATGELYNTIVWIDMQTNLPRQIEIQATCDDFRQLYLYQSIQIDEELDDELFSMAVPEDYLLEVTRGNWTIEKMEIVAKMIFLHRLCCMYANEFRGQWPDDLTDLVPSNLKSNEVLQTILAPAGHPEGKPLIKYQNKGSGGREPRVILYEVFDQWPDNGAMVLCFSTGEPQLITDQKEFEELIK